jgi:hypothetical protein
MVLAHFGDLRTEAELRSLLDTEPTGTRAGNIMRISGPAFEVYLRPSNMADLQKVLAENQPPIVLMQTGALEYWNADIFHTAVLVGLDPVNAILHDPYFATVPQTTSLQSFEKAWSQTGQFTAFIRPRKTHDPLQTTADG